MTCKYCNAEISEGSKFCTSCGRALEEATLVSENSAEVSEESVLISASEGKEPIGGENLLMNESKALETAVDNSAEINRGYSPMAENIEAEGEEIGARAEEASDNIPYSAPSVPAPAPDAGPDVTYMAPVIVKPSKKKPKAGKGQTVLVSVLLGILIFVFVFFCENLMLTRSVLSKRSISSAISGINPSDTKIGALLLSEGIKAPLEEMGVDVAAISEDTTVGEFLASLSIDFPIAGEDIEKLLERTDIMEEIAVVAADYENYLITGHGGDYLSAKTLLAVIYDHRKDILMYTGVDIAEYSDKIEETVESMKTEIKDMNAESALGGLGRMSYILLNPVAIVGAAVLAIVFTVIIITVTRRPFAALLTLGIDTALSGLIFFLASVFHPLIISLCVNYGDDLNIILTKLFRTSLFDDMMGISLIFMGIGALLIAIKAVQHSVIKRRERAAAAMQPQA